MLRWLEREGILMIGTSGFGVVCIALAFGMPWESGLFDGSTSDGIRIFTFLSDFSGAGSSSRGVGRC